MIAEIQTGLSSLSVAVGLLKTINAGATQVAINEVKISLQEEIFKAQNALTAAQAAQTAALERIRELEHEVMQLKDWKAESKRYQLTPVDQTAFVFMHKPGMEGGEPPHWLCENCFRKGHAASLQYRGTHAHQGGMGIMAIWGCNACDGKIAVNRFSSPSAPPPAGQA